jgi:hypothetical protein
MLARGHDDRMVAELRTTPTIQLLRKVVCEGMLSRKEVLIRSAVHQIVTPVILQSFPACVILEALEGW